VAEDANRKVRAGIRIIQFLWTTGYRHGGRRLSGKTGE